MGPHLERGLGYLATGSADAATAFLRTSPSARSLWITAREAGPVADGGEVLHVSTLAGKLGAVDPKRLGDLCAAASAFLAKDGESLVLLDCLEYLVLHNGPDRVARALADLHDEVAVRGGSLVVFVNPNNANPRLVAWLARELEPLAWVAPGASVPSAALTA